MKGSSLPTIIVTVIAAVIVIVAVVRYLSTNEDIGIIQSDLDVSVYPSAVRYSISSEMRSSFGVSSDDICHSFSTSASADDVVSWFEEEYNDWDLANKNSIKPSENPDEMVYTLLFEKDGKGLYVFIVGGVYNNKNTVFGVVSGEWDFVSLHSQFNLDDFLSWMEDFKDSNNSNDSGDDNQNDNEKDPVIVTEALEDMVFSSLGHFPINLTDYENTVDLDSCQLDIRSGSPALITPYMTHFASDHYEGSGKWYVYPHGYNFEVFTPGRVLIKKSDVESFSSKTISVINGNSTYVDADLNMYFDSDKRMMFGHLNVLVSLINDVMNSDDSYLIINPRILVGYTDDEWTLDILMWDTTVDNGLSGYFENLVCPFSYFTNETQDQLLGFYNTYVYEAMKPISKTDPEFNSLYPGGWWPESELCSPVNINIDNSIWGRWYYKSGYRDTSFPSDANWYYFKTGVLIFLKKYVYTNPETFTRAWRTVNIADECPEWEGIYSGVYDEDVTNPANHVGCYVIYTSDNNVIALKQYNTNFPSTFYMRFELSDDEIEMEFFNTFSEAKNDFVSSTVYTKNESDGNPLPS